MANSPQVCFFLGANAPTGFYSLYDQLIDRESARDYFLIKGGPGCGKSTLMRRVAARMEAAGHTVEYIQCSGDPDSLDAVVIPSLGAALVDATAPHVVEPTCPGALERYVNLGACYDTAALKPMRQALVQAMEGYPACYRRAYRCLRAASEIRADLRALLETPQLEERLLRRAKGILSRECKKTGGQPGKAVQRFLGAVCCRGVVCHFDTAEALCQRRYVLCDSYGLAHPLLSALAAGAMAAGYDVTVCPDPAQPDRMSHLLIPSLSLAFLTSTPELPYEGHAYRRLRVDAMADPQAVRRSRARLRFGRKIAAALTEEAVEAMAQAKEKHDRLEALYNPHVDFDRVLATADRLAEELLG
ncbi:hypothetical protein [Pseudoflavonifractor phocaeensis]|uniref:hypothetical protein n=1 Tax=Pseudoflavonifractor phocaeensis TaxID=1870988 RepID=UPI001FAF858E|nr:hypothetical protein [Pseudoflavonifractor phocaeensis]